MNWINYRSSSTQWAFSYYLKHYGQLDEKLVTHSKLAQLRILVDISNKQHVSNDSFYRGLYTSSDRVDFDIDILRKMGNLHAQA